MHIFSEFVLWNIVASRFPQNMHVCDIVIHRLIKG